MYSKKIKRGFTLVEILIVMMILGFLSTLAVNGYTQYRTTALFGLAIDDLVSRVYELKTKATYGIGAGNNYEHIKGILAGDSQVPDVAENQPKCYGILWSKNSDGSYTSRFFVQNFESKKVWFADKWNYLGCGGDPVELNFLPVENADTQFHVTTISLNGMMSNSLMIRFLPPSGMFEVKDDSGEVLGVRDFRELKMEVVYGAVDSTNRKVVDFDLVRAIYNVLNADNAQ